MVIPASWNRAIGTAGAAIPRLDTANTWSQLQTFSAGISGVVHSVALALPNVFTVSGSPVTSTGTLTGSLATQLPNLVWASDASGATATPTFRAIVGSDLPTNNATGVSSYAILKNTGSGTIAPGSVISTAAYIVWDSGGTIAVGSTITGNYRNYSGATLLPNYSGLCVKIS